MLKNLFIKLVQRFLHRPDLKLSTDIPMWYYMRIVWQRVWMLVRGYVKGVLFGKKGKRLFIGKRTSFICLNQIYAGSGVSIQEGVVLNALSKEGVHLGDNSSIGANSVIKVSGSMFELGKGFWIGKNSSLANDCFVGAAGGVEIGDYVAIGQCVRFHSENHDFSDVSKKICEQGTTHKGIKIGDDCWIGAGAVFLDGAVVGNGCVVGANAVVNGVFPDYSVIAGVPARIIRNRKDECI